MKTIYSYGIIPLMKKDNQRYTILVRLSSGQHRGIPKWHPKKKEMILDTMKRECHEETWLCIKSSQIDRTTTYVEEYIYRSPKKQKKKHKIVLYHPAVIPFVDINALQWYSESDGEILEKKLIDLESAQHLLTHKTSREILQKVSGYLDTLEN